MPLIAILCYIIENLLNDHSNILSTVTSSQIVKGLPKIDHSIKQQLNLHETSDAADADAAKD